MPTPHHAVADHADPNHRWAPYTLPSLAVGKSLGRSIASIVMETEVAADRDERIAALDIALGIGLGRRQDLDRLLAVKHRVPCRRTYCAVLWPGFPDWYACGAMTSASMRRPQNLRR